MLLPSLRRLALADVTAGVLEQLVDHGESLYVERKQAMPAKPRFGETAASFANTLGGFILLGVTDDGNVCGWERDNRLDVQSHLGALLRGQVDPMPPFVADVRDVRGKPVGIVRVFESSDAPHVVRGTGAVYVRTSKGKEPVTDHSALVALARKGDQAEAEARRRFIELPAVTQSLRARDAGYSNPADPNFRVVVRAAPLTVPPTFRDWPLREDASQAVQAAADRLVEHGSYPYHREGPTQEIYGRAIAGRVAQPVSSDVKDHATVVVDSGGVIGAAYVIGMHKRDKQPSLSLESIMSAQLRRMAMTIAELFDRSETHGRVVTDAQVMIPVTATISEQRRPAGRWLHVADELTVPADQDEVEAMVQRWYREMQRGLGIEAWEEPTSN